MRMNHRQTLFLKCLKRGVPSSNSFVDSWGVRWEAPKDEKLTKLVLVKGELNGIGLVIDSDTNGCRPFHSPGSTDSIDLPERLGHSFYN